MTLTGLYVPLITPFDHDGAVALGALEALANDVLDGGAAGVVALGTTGEPSSLTREDRHRVVDLLARVCGERSAPLVVGADSAEVARALSRWPQVTATLSVVPPFLRPGEAGVLAHFTDLAAASPVPVLVYHVPYRTGQQLSAGAIRRLAALDNVVGVKHAVGGIDADTVDLLADPPADFAILGGEDAFISPLLALGAHGGILASAHVATARFADLVAAWRAGDATTARALGRQLAPLSTALFAEPNPTVLKAVLHAQGRIPTAAVRPPLLAATAESTKAALLRT
ncbi:4-hydroxy-tetrahydrodipicolinate synthase family protein [Asanoa iriomotensis]|uniref:4-hydroxy-tetrahydrodipicolinate synthase n=1 Tax=Asanoa iriomotensis TaxID=234613 RepID=A0ABQ4C7W8_9ACTN|nr:4-hydroxy-tetrahydrodipicolinate synthase [Asanoa iriomotensis]GIF58873.1 4-hydroxy-tetrahydrodipicolinate synthase 2 [Asanoa iriomotensis]